jgi:hypothetical protein
MSQKKLIRKVFDMKVAVAVTIVGFALDMATLRWTGPTSLWGMLWYTPAVAICAVCFYRDGVKGEADTTSSSNK